jgi:hypothetical protein
MKHTLEQFKNSFIDRCGQIVHKFEACPASELPLEERRAFDICTIEALFELYTMIEKFKASFEANQYVGIKPKKYGIYSIVLGFFPGQTFDTEDEAVNFLAKNGALDTPGLSVREIPQ